MSTLPTLSASAPRILRDVEYSQAGGVSLRFDASIPDSRSPVPAAILVHGGGWVRGDRMTNLAPLFKPLEDAGVAWFTISYSLASDPLQIGTAVVDVENALRFIRARATEYNVDPDRIVLIGESAGGQLAAMAALGPAASGSVKGVVAIYAPTDLVSLARSSTLIPESIREKIRGTVWETLLLARLGRLSPIASIHAGMPPFLLIHGDSDNLVPIDQSKAMCEKMNAAGASCVLVTVPGAGHGIRRWEGIPSKSEPYKREMVAWIRRQLSLS